MPPGSYAHGNGSGASNTDSHNDRRSSCNSHKPHTQFCNSGYSSYSAPGHSSPRFCRPRLDRRCSDSPLIKAAGTRPICRLETASPATMACGIVPAKTLADSGLHRGLRAWSDLAPRNMRTLIPGAHVRALVWAARVLCRQLPQVDGYNSSTAAPPTTTLAIQATTAPMTATQATTSANITTT